LAELTALGDGLAASAGVTRSKVTQTVIGSPGVYDPGRGALRLGATDRADRAPAPFRASNGRRE
jgi:hypothetical protein